MCVRGVESFLLSHAIYPPTHLKMPPRRNQGSKESMLARLIIVQKRMKITHVTPSSGSTPAINPHLTE